MDFLYRGHRFRALCSICMCKCCARSSGLLLGRFERWRSRGAPHIPNDSPFLCSELKPVEIHHAYEVLVLVCAARTCALL